MVLVLKALFQELRRNGENVVYSASLEDVVEYLVREVHSGDTVLTVGAGNVWTVGNNIAQNIKQHYRHN